MESTGRPWRYEGPDDFGDYNILHGGDSLAVAAVVSNMRPPEEVAANATLIAAAPDLYSALLDAIPALIRTHKMLPGGLGKSDALLRLNKAKAALQAARGE